MSRISRCRNTYSLSPATELARERWTNSLRSSSKSSSSAAARFGPPTASSAPSQKTLPRTDASWSSRFSSSPRAVETCGDDPLDRLGQLGKVASLEQHPRVLLGVERVATSARQERLLGLGIEQRPFEQGTDQARRVLVRERRERDCQSVRLASAPARASLEQLRPRGAEDEQRHPAHPRDQSVDELEQGVVGPVQVFEDEHERPLLGKRLEKPAPGGRALLGAAGVLLGDPGERPQVPL